MDFFLEDLPRKCQFVRRGKNHRFLQMLLWSEPQHDFVDFQKIRIHIIFGSLAAKVPLTLTRATFGPTWSHLNRRWHSLFYLHYSLLSLLPLIPKNPLGDYHTLMFWAWAQTGKASSGILTREPFTSGWLLLLLPLLPLFPYFPSIPSSPFVPSSSFPHSSPPSPPPAVPLSRPPHLPPPRPSTHPFRKLPSQVRD